MLYLFIPKGFFLIQDNGLIQGTFQAPQSVSFSKMAILQQQVAAQLLQDPAVESLTSFIGVDGTNTTLNSGRLQINLKLAERTQWEPIDDHSAYAAIGSPATRLKAVFATRAKSDHRHSGQPDAILVHPTSDVAGAAQPLGTAIGQGVAANASIAGCQQRLARSGAGRLYINVDRDTASRLGIQMSNADNAP